VQPEPKFPSWAPPEGIAQWREEVRAADERARSFDAYCRAMVESASKDARGAAALKAANFPVARAALRTDLDRVPHLFQRLLTDPEMEAVWTFLAKAGTYACGIPHTVLFCAEVRRAWRGPVGEEQWTRGEREQWAKDVTNLAQELASRLQGTRADDFLWRRYSREWTAWTLRPGAPAQSTEDGLAAFNWHPGQVSDLLRSIACRSETLLAPALLRRPGHSLARRAYFVRRLDDWCRQAMGKRRMMLIHKTAMVVLEDKTLDRCQIYRLLREIPPRGDASSPESAD
jgi:hypothetical protein